MTLHNHFSKLVVAASLAGAIQGASAQRQINVTVNGQPVAFEATPPMQVQGRVLVPLRGVLEQMGAYVGWDALTQNVSASKGDLALQMRIGSRVAQVNGRDVTLDVPARIIDGSTMVPLRFISEALGANVQWVEATQTVAIDTAITSAVPSQQPAVPITQPSPSAVAISTFTIDKNGYLAPGSTVHFTMTGTPGGQATFQIPGATTSDIPMRETQPGTYVADWTVPATSDQGLMMNETTAVGRLVIGNQEQAAVTTTAFSLDTVAPKVIMMHPGAEGLFGSHPTISARFDDSPGSGVDPSTVKVSLDGQDITGMCSINAGGFNYRPDRDLAPGPHQVNLTMNDRAGNLAASSWTFNVAERRNTPFLLNYTPLPVYDAGKTIDFTLDADPGSTATITIGNRVAAFPLQEASPGHYVGHYTVREGDAFYSEPVIAHVRTADGKEYTVEASSMLGTQTFEMKQPTVVSPKENEQVSSPLIIKGSAAPYSSIQIHVAYSALTTFNQIRLHGGLGDYSATADQNGYFQSLPIDLDKIRGANKRFTVTVWAVDNEGKKSAVTTLNISQ